MGGLPNDLGALLFDSRKGVQLPNIIPQSAMLLEPKIFTQSIASDALILDELDVISVVPDVRSGHVPSPALAPVVDARAVSAALAPVVAQQVAIAVHKAPGGVVEIILNPEELGRVRVSMQAQDGVMTMTITTERIETQDLMRRHIDALAQEMRALGYRDVGFNFQGQNGDGGNSQRGSADKQSPEIEHPVLETTLLAVTSGLDLRL
jgi:flagellar hook-length control protein FliK